MSDYSFQNLSPIEFENLVRDLLQAEYNVRIESFTEGRYGGIDLYYKGDKGGEFIVQCKRYKDITSLMYKLPGEAAKLAKLKPKRYIFATSVGLTHANKKDIKKIFSPYIKRNSDILGRDDINNLIGLHQSVEKKHYKLWLSSTSILNAVLHSKIYNQSESERVAYEKAANVYVQNDSYHQALKILTDERYVIISGIPGIGKTTLARVIARKLVLDGYQEFIYLSNSIDEGESLFQIGLKQVFLFDDFLGSNFLNRNLGTNEEKRILAFIKKVNTSKDKLMILTTREYILAQAKQRYEVLNKPVFDAKCIIDLSQYTTLIRAKILYNHLYFSDVPSEFIADLLVGKRYDKIVKHKNYNPRIIEAVITPKLVSQTKAEDFANKFINLLDDPYEVWKVAFESQISPLSQCILANMMSTGTPVLWEDLKKITQSFLSKHKDTYVISSSSIELSKALKELDGTFVLSEMDSESSVALNYHNPSIQDFLVNYFRQQPEYVEHIIESALSFAQLFGVITIENSSPQSEKANNRSTNRILLSGENAEKLLDKAVVLLDIHKSIRIYKTTSSQSKTNRWCVSEISIYEKLNTIRQEVCLACNSTLRSYVINKIQENILPDHDSDIKLSDYRELITEFKDELDLDSSKVMNAYLNHVYIFEDLLEFEFFRDIFGGEIVEEFVFEDKQGLFNNKTQELINWAIEDTDNSDAQDILESIRSIKANYDIIDYEDLNKFQERASDYQSYLDSQIEDHIESGGREFSNKVANYDKEISILFESLPE